jgi:hypothetical protein
MRAAVVLACLALAGCAGVPVVATVDTGDEAAAVTVDGWGLSASCKLGHVCVATPIAPLCWPIPAKLAERVCRG